MLSDPKRLQSHLYSSGISLKLGAASKKVLFRLSVFARQQALISHPCEPPFFFVIFAFMIPPLELKSLLSARRLRLSFYQAILTKLYAVEKEVSGARGSAFFFVYYWERGEGFGSELAQHLQGLSYQNGKL